VFAIERIKIIKNYLIENKQLEVNILSKMLNVSEVTIRRDLEKLEKEGFITRTHGGAVLSTGDSIYNESLLTDITIISTFFISDIS
jgi:DeoR/GlpR family transcriptional regulator of sugar metabolism